MQNSTALAVAEPHEGQHRSRDCAACATWVKEETEREHQAYLARRNFAKKLPALAILEVPRHRARLRIHGRSFELSFKRQEEANACFHRITLYGNWLLLVGAQSFMRPGRRADMIGEVLARPWEVRMWGLGAISKSGPCLVCGEISAAPFCIHGHFMAFIELMGASERKFMLRARATAIRGRA